MGQQEPNINMVTKLMFRLLPVQVLLCMVGLVNALISSFFATNYVGIDAMSAVGLYGPLGMLITSVSTILVGGSAILCGRYLGENKQEELQNVFKLTIAADLLIALLFMLVFGSMGAFDLSGIITQDPSVRPYFNSYLIGQVVGVAPTMLGSALASLLSLENKAQRSLMASICYIVTNLILNFVFVQMLHLEAFGLALASSLGMWVFFGVQAQFFLSGKSHFKLVRHSIEWSEALEIIRIGLPGAASNIYQTARGLIVNYLLGIFVGSVGISAFATANNLMGIFWAIPGGMLAVSRMVISVSVGEEDRQTLADVMRVMFRRYIPLMCIFVAGIIILAVPLTHIFYQDTQEPVFAMTVLGFRILPLCMPLSIICMHFTCYGQTSGKTGLVHVLALLDGVVCVAGFTALLIPLTGIASVYLANVLNGVVTTLVIFGYSFIKNGHAPSNMEELMVVPDGFGASEDERIDVSIRTIEDAVDVSRRVESFCKERGISQRSAYIAALSMEEMAGNVVDHGFTKDNRKHSVDIRVVHKDNDVILRIKDDCVPFDPGERLSMTDPTNPMKNLGISMVFKVAKDVQYQSILGLNVLTIRIDA